MEEIGEVLALQFIAWRMSFFLFGIETSVVSFPSIPFSGLGRASSLVAVALIEKGLEPLETIQFIRKQRPRAFNRKQLEFNSKLYQAEELL